MDSGRLRSSTIERLPALSWPNIVPAPSRCTGRLRIRSPSGDSTLTTSAPMSASSRLQCGPAMVVEKSSTRRPCSGRASVSVIGSSLGSSDNQDKSDAADHKDAADPFAGGRPLLEHDVRSDESEDKLDLADGADQRRILERHGERPAGRTEHAEDADPDRRAPIEPYLAELRPVAAREVGCHQHNLDGVHAGEHGDAADHEVAVGQELGGLADGEGGDREDG